MAERQARAATVSAASEEQFQGTVRGAAAVYGWELCYHTHDSRRSDRGWPDLVLAHPVQARVLFVELKSDVGVISQAQRSWLLALHSAGAEAGVWRPRDTPEILRVLGPTRERLVLTASMVGLDELPEPAAARR